MSTEEYHPALDDPTAWVPYRYHPSNVAAIIFVVAFSATTLLHVFQLFKKRTWYFIPLVVGGIFEIVGFIGRILSHNDLWALGPFSRQVMQSLLILIAPALFAASIYIILGRIILLVDGERYALVRQKWLTKIFVAGDVFSFLLQGAGNALHTGEKLIIAGLFTQLFFFAIFVIVGGIFHYRLVNDNPLQKRMKPRTNGTHRHISSTSSSTPIAGQQLMLNRLPWKRHLYNLYLTSGLIMVRSIFRVVEYLQGNAGYLLSHEVFLYVFDAVLMLAVMVLFNWSHPSEVTEAYNKRQMSAPTSELQDMRNQYMGHDLESGREGS
ncbi:RTA1 like protein-domain-containing protein [Phaeosphaeria sp. MPI-PUGE-AT-0046c]|nr:RTA1 like protein-domain-containing protein [Phaeosphaeria sp. MPI-PUGE-AT-0046c]